MAQGDRGDIVREIRRLEQQKRQEERRKVRMAQQGRWNWFLGASAFLIRLTALVWIVAVPFTVYQFIQDAVAQWGRTGIDVNAALSGGGIVIFCGALTLILWYITWNLFQLERWAGLLMLIAGVGTLLTWWAFTEYEVWPAPAPHMEMVVFPLFEWGIPLLAGLTVVFLLVGQSALSE